MTPLRSNTGAIVPTGCGQWNSREFRFVARATETASGSSWRSRQMGTRRGIACGDPRRVRRPACLAILSRISLLDGVDVFENFRLDGMGLDGGRVK